MYRAVFFLVVACVLWSGALPTRAQDAEPGEAEDPGEAMERADQEVIEIEEPAPEGVELDLTNPDVAKDAAEWDDSDAGEAGVPDEGVPAYEEPEEEPEEEREKFGERFRRGELFGFFDAQARFFPQSAAPQGVQRDQPPANDYYFNGSLAWEPGFFMNITDYMNFELILFGRVDQHDPKRTHGDIREAFFELFFDAWSFGFGVHKVFWGVTESKHLVDIINQTDLVEDFDADIKLGQAMITTSYTNDKAGIFSLYAMSWARPLVFPSLSGRPTLPIPVDNGARQYESPWNQGQIDVAFRWSHAVGGFDWGLSYFFGTTREPQLIPNQSAEPPTSLIPVYELIHQVGFDGQYTVEGWLLKVEAIMREGQPQLDVDGQRAAGSPKIFGAITGGFEYTFYGAGGSIVDIGLILEYNYDSRDNNSFIVFQNDFFVGVRLTLSDVGSTEFLVGSFIDRIDGSVFIAAEAARRFGDNWKILLEGRGYIPQGTTDFTGNINPLRFFQQDAVIQVDVEFRY
ncbi:MAG: hypothetical protein AAF436_12635 [Myxococcota bacterium]